MDNIIPTEKEQNIAFWDSVEKTDPVYTSEAEISGRKMTSIDAYFQIKNATREWGMYGTTWGLKDIDLKLEKMDDDTTICLYKAVFWYPGGRFEIHNSLIVKYKVVSKGYIKVDADFAKKIETNTITKSLSKLGFNTDIFIGKFEDPMYVKEVQTEFENDKVESYMDILEETKTYAELEKQFLKLPARMKIHKDVIALKDELKKTYENTKLSK